MRNTPPPARPRRLPGFGQVSTFVWPSTFRRTDSSAFTWIV
jgi:hypothetical protein